ncbi:hypothetical protein M8818_005397 [Zalaria obscura]|uniref:Uncharacterized protein n=1 Tax=Zalaria obscura TaxID=2024903 RepID=A0ACC3SC76_9PEZI
MVGPSSAHTVKQLTLVPTSRRPQTRPRSAGSARSPLSHCDRGRPILYNLAIHNLAITLPDLCRLQPIRRPSHEPAHHRARPGHLLRLLLPLDPTRRHLRPDTHLLQPGLPPPPRRRRLRLLRLRHRPAHLLRRGQGPQNRAPHLHLLYRLHLGLRPDPNSHRTDPASRALLRPSRRVVLGQFAVREGKAGAALYLDLHRAVRNRGHLRHDPAASAPRHDCHPPHRFPKPDVCQDRPGG